MNEIYIKGEKDGWLEIGGVGNFSVFKTFDCGQCFRFDFVADERFSCRVDGVAMGREVSFADGKGTPDQIEKSLFVRSTKEDFYNIWLSYLSLDCDYDKYDSEILAALHGKDANHMKLALDASAGIRILRQEPWEALCSFIVSQNNNIPRIKKIIRKMALEYGEKTGEDYSFPTALSLFEAGEENIFNLKTGFRAKYIYDAAKKIATGEINLSDVIMAKSYSEAEGILLKIAGVGPKVAACALLFGFGRGEAFPIDVWIKKVIEKRFENGLDPVIFSNNAGLAQQYLFYYERFVSEK